MTAWKRCIAGYAAVVVSLLPILAQGQGNDPASDAAQHFYQKYQRIRATGKFAGIADHAKLAQIAPLLTPQLRALFAVALKEQGRCKKLFPEDVPPWIDGDIFTSSSEGFSSFLPMASKPSGDGRRVSIRFNFIYQRNKVEWSDTLSLKEIDGVWLVDDVLYRATFAYTSGFGAHLQGALSQMPAC